MSSSFFEATMNTSCAASSTRSASTPTRRNVRQTLE
jgi:hypothetical protein